MTRATFSKISVRMSVLLSALVVSHLHAETAAGGDDIAIGLMQSKTGVYMVESSYNANAAQLAVKQINDAGGINGRKIKLFVEDNQSTNPGALTSFQNLVETNKVVAVIGPQKSSQILAFAPTGERLGIPTMIGGTNPRLTDPPNRWLLRFRPDDSVAASAMVLYLKSTTKATKFAIKTCSV